MAWHEHEHAWHEHVILQDYPGGPSVVRGSHIVATKFGPETRDHQLYDSIQEETLIPPSKGKQLLKYKLKSSCIA